MTQLLQGLNIVTRLMTEQTCYKVVESSTLYKSVESSTLVTRCDSVIRLTCYKVESSTKVVTTCVESLLQG